jgi:hypothetical protein
VDRPTATAPTVLSRRVTGPRPRSAHQGVPDGDRERPEGKGVERRWVDTLPFPHDRERETHRYMNAVREPGALSTLWKAN